EQLGTKKVAGKTMERLKKLIWLAAQDVKAELSGRDTYEYQALAELVGVTPKNWSETFTDRWVEMRRIFLRLDSGALLQVTRSRSQQKATNFDRSLAKLD
ncbi:TPA: bacteriophage antitermination protein Q, partial [Enterobacter hormaechei]